MPEIINVAKQKLEAGELAIGVGLRMTRVVEVGKMMKTDKNKAQAMKAEVGEVLLMEEGDPMLEELWAKADEDGDFRLSQLEFPPGVTPMETNRGRQIGDFLLARVKRIRG